MSTPAVGQPTPKEGWGPPEPLPGTVALDVTVVNSWVTYWDWSPARRPGRYALAQPDKD